jgi:hypothetical protein
LRLGGYSLAQTPDKAAICQKGFAGLQYGLG